MQQNEKEPKWIPALSLKYSDIDIQVGDRIRLYGAETTVEGFQGSYNEGLGRWETIIMTIKRGDPFERSLDVIEIDENKLYRSPYSAPPPVIEIGEQKGDEFAEAALKDFKAWCDKEEDQFQVGSAEQFGFRLGAVACFKYRQTEIDLLLEMAAKLNKGWIASAEEARKLTEIKASPVLRWVKEEDDLPFNENREYHLRYPTEDGWERLTAFFDHSAKEFYTVESNCKMVYMPSAEFAGLEWLEESSPAINLPSNEGEEPGNRTSLTQLFDRDFYLRVNVTSDLLPENDQNVRSTISKALIAAVYQELGKWRNTGVVVEEFNPGEGAK